MKVLFLMDVWTKNRQSFALIYNTFDAISQKIIEYTFVQ